MRIRLARLIFFTALIIGMSGSVFASSPYSIDVEPVFQGLLPVSGVIPLQVTILNSGSDSHGVLRVRSGRHQVSYPIELPRGADKRLIVYPSPDYEDVSFELVTDQDRAERDFKLGEARTEGLHLLLVTTDGPGELSFLKKAAGTETTAGGAPGSNSSLTLNDCYAKPNELPDRAVGYQGISEIILGSGSERLSDDQIAAIKQAVITGKSLVFIGGASAPVLADRRWAGLIPAGDFHVVDLNDSEVLEKLGHIEGSVSESPVPNVSVSTGKTVQGATSRKDGDILISAEQPYGIGKVIYISFNPFESPINKWDRRQSVMVKLLRATDTLAAESFLGSYSAGMPNYGVSTMYTAATVPAPGASAASGFSSPSGEPIESDPFSTKLPSPGRIFLILGTYFVAVVPINFLLLKKFKRGELAWFTAPILSLGFAGVLFASASSLYKAKMSTVSSGVVVAQEGDPEGVFIGGSQMFIPHGGSYDLKLQGVDSLSASNGESYDGDPSAENEDMVPVDNGELHIPNLSANNLTFRRLEYRERVPISHWFHVKLSPNGKGKAQCVATNIGPYRLEGASISVGGNLDSLGTLAPGQSKTMTVGLMEMAVPDLPPGDVRTLSLHRNRVVLTGRLTGFRPGPQMGEELSGRSSVTLALCSAWEDEKP